MSAEKIQELTPKDQVVALVANDCVDAAIITLNEKYKGLKAVDEDSFTLVKKGLKEYVSRRTAIEDRRLSLKRDVDAEAKRITALLAPGEAALKKEKDAWDDKIKAAAAEKERLNKVRIKKIQARIATFSMYLQNIMTKSADDLKSDLDFLKSCIAADTFNYEEFINDAEKTKATTEKALFDAYTQRKALEDREAEVAKQQAIIDEANRIIAKKAEDDRLEQERLEAIERNKNQEELRAAQPAPLPEEVILIDDPMAPPEECEAINPLPDLQKINSDIGFYGWNSNNETPNELAQSDTKITHTTGYQAQGSSAMRPMVFDGSPNDPLIKSGLLKQWDEIETNSSMGQGAKLELLIGFIEEITLANGKYPDLNGHQIVIDARKVLQKIGVSK